MKRYLRLLISAVLIMPIVSLATTALVNAEGTSTTTTTTQSDSTDTESPDDVSLLKRLTDRKAALNIKLTTAEQARLKLKCKIAQTGAISSLSGRIKGIETSRTQVYNNLLDQLNKFDTKLKAKNVDTTTFEAEIATLKTKIATFQTDLATYKQDVVDLKSLDCLTDPTAFKAALETARTQKTKVAADAADIKTYVTGTIRPTLVAIRTQLGAAENASTSTSSTTGGDQ